MTAKALKTVKPRFTTREEWLVFVANELRPYYKAHDCEIPADVRFAIGFTSTGYRSNRIGECWSPKASGDKHIEILIKPTESKPEQVAGILAHELIHAWDRCENGHKTPFKHAMKRLGFEGKATQAMPGADMMAKVIAPILKKAGPLPHAALAAFKMKKKQTTRLLKCECAECGYTVRVTAKWLEEAGAPYCGHKSHGRMQCDAIEDDGGDE